MALHDGIIDLQQNFKEVLSGNHNHRSGSFFTAPIMYCWAKQLGAKKILEIGIGAGSAGYWLGHAAKEMDGQYFGIEINQSRVNGLSALMDQFEIPNKIWCSPSLKIDQEFIRTNIGGLDMAYLDGDHSLEAIRHEMFTVWPFIKGGGFGYAFIHDIYTASKDGWAFVKEEYAGIADIMEIKAQSGMGIVRKI